MSARRLNAASCGFTMLELLVAVVALSVGVLGVASLQILMTQSSFGASQRTEATMLANALIDRMRANSEQLATYADSELNGSDSPSGQPLGCTAVMSESACLLATARLDLWELHLAAYQADTLIKPTVCVARGAADGDVSVTVAWHGMSKRAGGAEAPANACGRAGGDRDATLQQVVMNTYIATSNPY